MAFDPSNATQVAALKSELTVDPVNVGYNLNGSVSKVTEAANDPDSNTGGLGRGETVEETLTTRRFWEICADNPDDLTPHGAFSAGDQFVVQQLFEITAGIDDDLNWARASIISLFPANDGIVADINALIRVQSRAEVLFGNGTVLSENDVNIALSS